MVPAYGGPLPWDGIRRILLCRPNRRLGNLLFLTPVLAEIEARHPGATVDIVGASDGLPKLFRGFRNVGTVLELPPNPFHAPGQFARVVHSLWRNRYDLVIDPELRSRSARFLVNRCQTTYRLGFTGAGNAARLTHGVPSCTAPSHMSRRAVYLLRRASPVADAEPAVPYPELDLRLRPAERRWGAALVARILRQDGTRPQSPVIALFANATGAKRYPSEWWQRLAAQLGALLPRAAFLEILPPGVEGASALGLPTYQSRDLRQVAAVIGATSLFVSADCGILHLACASGVPRVIGLFSVTDPAVYGPVGAGRRAIVTRGLTPEDVAQAVGANLIGVGEDCALRPRIGAGPNEAHAS
jgi:heptosyltransferase III